MTDPFLSIITINYNNTSGLKRTMQIVFDQTFQDYEYIIIDGDSNDGSVDIIKENETNLSYWISEKDSGIFNAMNKGIKVSKGKYLLFLNSGDVLTSKFALGEFINHPFFKGHIIYGDYKFDKGEKIYPDVLYPAYFMKTSLPHQSTFFKRDVFKEMGLYDEKYKIGADRAYYIKCYLSEKFKFQHVPYFLTHFDLSGVSNSKEIIKRKKEEDELLLREEYGTRYQVYKDELELQFKKNAAKRRSLKGIVKRIIKRIKS